MRRKQRDLGAVGEMVGHERDLIHKCLKPPQAGCLGIARRILTLVLVSKGIIPELREDLERLELGIDHMPGSVHGLTALQRRHERL